jgi:hypothetical protein
MATEQQINELAYRLWEQEGRPHGRDRDHYLAAKRMLEEQTPAGASNGHAESSMKKARTSATAAAKPKTATATRTTTRAKKTS